VGFGISNKEALVGKKGVTQIEVLMWLIGGFVAVLGYVHITFATYREVVPRLESLDAKIDKIIDRIKQ
jgi:hypothetical protein